MSKITRFLTGTVFVAVLLSTGAVPAQAASLRQDQISAIIGLLRAFNADQAVIARVQAHLSGTAVPTTTGLSCNNFTTDLQSGMRNASVTALQQFLIRNDYQIPAGATGLFGPQTRAAVISYQRLNNIPQTGYVGPMTRGRLNNAPCGQAPATNACRAGDTFNIMTGARCGLVCQGADVFNTMTGARCTSGSGSRRGGGGGGSSNDNSNQNQPVTDTTGPYDYNKDGVLDSADIAFLTDVVYNNATCPTGKTCDVNGDGGTSVADIIALNNKITPTSPTTSSFDYNGDGTITAADVTILTSVVYNNANCPTGKICDVNSDGSVSAPDIIALNNKVTPVVVNAPTCSMQATPATITSGSQSTLSWTTTNANSFAISGMGYMALVSQGSAGVRPTVTTIYTGTATGSGGTKQCSKTVTVTVPTTSAFDYNGSGVIDSFDVTYLTDVILGDKTCPLNKNCDVNGDTQMNIQDSIALAKMVQ